MLLDSKCKKCRRAGQKLFLKGERCFSQKCALTRRPYAPGAHGKSFKKRISEYGHQLAEKQKVRYTYGVSDHQFKKYFKEIIRQRGDKEELFIKKLEARLDNVVFRLGWAKSRRLARQMVSHGHLLVNQRKVNIPSYQVKKGDLIGIKKGNEKLSLFKDIEAQLKKHKVPVWLALDKKKFQGEVKNEPQVENLREVGEISMIIEYYSR
jgi:small subunit ribosomal protein S4